MEIISIVSGIVIGIFGTYVLMRIKEFSMRLDFMPDEEEIAKRILQMKLPIDDLPQETKERLQEMYGEQSEPPLPNVPNPPPKQEGSHYIG